MRTNLQGELLHRTCPGNPHQLHHWLVLVHLHRLQDHEALWMNILNTQDFKKLKEGSDVIEAVEMNQ